MNREETSFCFLGINKYTASLVSQLIGLTETCYLTEQETLDQETAESDCELLINHRKLKAVRFIDRSGFRICTSSLRQINMKAKAEAPTAMARKKRISNYKPT